MLTFVISGLLLIIIALIIAPLALTPLVMERRGYGQCVCSWCRRRIGWKPGLAGETTYGMCKKCARKNGYLS